MNLKRLFFVCACMLFIVLINACGALRGRYPNYTMPLPVGAVELIDTTLVDIPRLTDTQLRELHKMVPEPYRINPGDVFAFQVYDNLNLNMNSITITPDGYTSLPLIGPVKIGGLTLIEAHQALEKALQKYILDPKVSLTPLNIRGYRFCIAGKVAHPGHYPIEGDLTVMDAIALGGGFPTGEWENQTIELSDLGNSYMVRKGKILPVDFAKIVAGDSMQNVPLHNGDYIYIAAVSQVPVYVIGEVNSERPILYTKDLTLFRALSYAHGLKLGYDEEIFIVRGGLNHPTFIRVNVDMLRAGEAYDYPLQANDIVYVPKSGWKNYNEIVEQIMPSIQALNMLSGPFSNAALFRYLE